MRTIVVIAALSLLLAGCVTAPSASSAYGTSNVAAAGLGVGLQLPALGNLLCPPKPIAFCEGTQIVCPEGWRVCNGEQPDQMMMMPMSVDTANALLIAGAARNAKDAEAPTIPGEPEDEPEDEPEPTPEPE